MSARPDHSARFGYRTSPGRSVSTSARARSASASRRHAGDDGRRPLLARLRQRRLARPLRRQLVRERPTSPLGGHGGLPRSALFRNVRGHFVERHSEIGRAVSRYRARAASPPISTATAGTDLFVTTPPTRQAALEQRRRHVHRGGAGGRDRRDSGWYAGAAVGDVNGDGRPDLFVAGYTDPTLGADSIAGFPTNLAGVRDLLYLNGGTDGTAVRRSARSGCRRARGVPLPHALGALFTDFNGDGRPDLYVANDEDPNQLYENVAWPGGAAADPTGLGFRFEERGAAEGVDDPYAGMGIASGDYDGDGRNDLFVTNSRRETHATFRHRLSTDGPALQRRAAHVPEGVQCQLDWLGRLLGGPLARRNTSISSWPTAASRSPASRRTRARFRSSRTSRRDDGRGLRQRRRLRSQGNPARQRPWGRRRGLRQQRNRGHRHRLDRRAARAPSELGRPRPLARGAIDDVRTRAPW